MNESKGKHNSSTKRTSQEREYHRTEITKMALWGYTQTEMAEKLNISRQQVGYDLKKVEEEWRKEQVENLSILKKKQVKRYEFLLREALELYERSKQNKVTTNESNKSYSKQKGVVIKKGSVEGRSYGDGEDEVLPNEVEQKEDSSSSKRVSKRDGSVAALNLVREIISDISRLNGLEQVNINANVQVEGTIEHTLEKMSEDELTMLMLSFADSLTVSSQTIHLNPNKDDEKQ